MVEFLSTITTMSAACEFGNEVRNRGLDGAHLASERVYGLAIGAGFEPKDRQVPFYATRPRGRQCCDESESDCESGCESDCHLPFPLGLCCEQENFLPYTVMRFSR